MHMEKKKGGVAVLITKFPEISEWIWIPYRNSDDPRGQADLNILKFVNFAKPLNSAHLESTFYYFPK